MKDQAAMTFDVAKETATKVWIIGALQEYIRKDEKGEVISSTTIKGLTAGIKTESDKHPFTQKAKGSWLLSKVSPEREIVLVLSSLASVLSSTLTIALVQSLL